MFKYPTAHHPFYSGSDWEALSPMKTISLYRLFDFNLEQKL
jgi:hypothetical protein